MPSVIDAVLSELIADTSITKAANLAQHRLDGKPLNIKQQETLAEEFTRLHRILRDYANRTGPYVGVPR